MIPKAAARIQARVRGRQGRRHATELKRQHEQEAGELRLQCRRRLRKETKTAYELMESRDAAVRRIQATRSSSHDGASPPVRWGPVSTGTGTVGGDSTVVTGNGSHHSPPPPPSSPPLQRMASVNTLPRPPPQSTLPKSLAKTVSCSLPQRQQYIICPPTATTTEPTAAADTDGAGTKTVQPTQEMAREPSMSMASDEAPSDESQGTVSVRILTVGPHPLTLYGMSSIWYWLSITHMRA